MTLMRRLAAGAAVTTLALASVSAVYAQEISGGIAGHLVDETGKPVAGAHVAITYQPTGATVETSTSSDGYFTARNLPVGGPYLVRATATGHPERAIRIP